MRTSFLRVLLAGWPYIFTHQMMMFQFHLSSFRAPQTETIDHTQNTTLSRSAFPLDGSPSHHNSVALCSVTTRQVSPAPTASHITHSSFIPIRFSTASYGMITLHAAGSQLSVSGLVLRSCSSRANLHRQGEGGREG